MGRVAELGSLGGFRKKKQERIYESESQEDLLKFFKSKTPKKRLKNKKEERRARRGGADFRAGVGFKDKTKKKKS